MAENLVSIPVISASFNVLLDTIIKEFLSYVRGGKSVIDSCVLRLKLRTTMLALTAVLNAAKEKQITDLTVLEWLDELASIIYDAEDLEDDIQTKLLRLKVNAESQMEPKSADNASINADQATANSSSSADEPVRRFLVARLMTSSAAGNELICGPAVEKLIHICEKLDAFLPQITILGLEPFRFENKRPQVPHHHVLSTKLANFETSMVGRESETEEVISFLLSRLNRSTEVSMVSIVGAPGVGKTTFAQMIFDCPRLKEIFDIKSWISVSSAMEADGIIKEILNSLNKANVPNDHLHFLQVKLCKLLLGKTFLLILDDVLDLSPKSWDDLLCPLRRGPNKVVIILTTCNEDVAVKTSLTGLRLQLKPLSDEDCFTLFKSAAARDEQARIDGALEEIGKQIAEKCKGSPLAAIVLGRNLACMLDVEYWDAALRSEAWDHSVSWGQNDHIPPALTLSYSYLSSPLKRCFAYCSLFPKNYKIEREKLILLWIAEGFVQASNSHETSLEEVGNKYFLELLSRSFLQQSHGHFVMHNLIHDLAQHASKHFCFTLDTENPQVFPSKTRHLSYIKPKHDKFEYFEAIDGYMHVKGLRTFLPLKSSSTNLSVLDDDKLHSFLLKLNSLRVLSLSYYDIKDIPQSLVGLRHIRFLDLRRTSIRHLPEFVCNMYTLQTLILCDCPYLTTLPHELGNLVSLRHLNIGGSNKLQEMPLQISKLNKLCTLTNFVVGKDRGAKILALSEFHNLRGHLTISGLQNVNSKSDSSEANMKTKLHLHELTLEWEGKSRNPLNEEAVLHLLKPTINLKVISIRSYGGKRFANWLGANGFCDLVAMQLTNCYHCICLPALGQLPSLKQLHIEDFAMLETVGPAFYGATSSSSKPFPVLEILKLKNMPEWKTWSPCPMDGESFASLQELYLYNCPKLSGNLPVNLPSVQKLEIVKCGQLGGSLPQLPAIQNLRLHECEMLELRRVADLITLVSLNIRSMSTKNSLVSDLHQLASLTELKIECSVGSNNPMIVGDDNSTQCLPGYTMLIGDSLQDLSIRNCGFQLICQTTSLISLNISHCKTLELNATCFSSLQSLDMSHCGSLETFRFEFFPMLKHLEIEGCSKLKAISIPQEIVLQYLYKLSFTSCPNLSNFPSQGLHAPNLNTFSVINCKRLRCLPVEMNNHLISLRLLSLVSCQNLEPVQGWCLPPNLYTLHIKYCPKFIAAGSAWRAQLPTSIKNLDFEIPLQH